MEENQKQTATPEEEAKRARFWSILLRVLTVILTALLVVGAILLVLGRDTFNLDSIKRYLTYQALELNDDGQSAEFTVAEENNSIFTAMDDCLIVCSSNRILFYSDSGTIYVDQEVSLSNPVIHIMGGYALIYDAGGSELYLYSGRQLIFSYTADSNALISAQVNENGWLAIVEQASGYKGAVTVYNADNEAVITENISSSFVMDAAVSPDNRQLAVATVGQEDLDFISTITVYNVTDGESSATAAVSNTPALELRWNDDGIWIQEQSGVRLLDASCQQLGSWSDESLYLCGYSLMSDNCAVEYFSRSQASSLGELMVVDTTGTVTASLEINEEVLSVTAAGKYIVVLTTNSLTVYNQALEEYASMENSGSILQALARSDGTAVLLTSETASIYLP